MKTRTHIVFGIIIMLGLFAISCKKDSPRYSTGSGPSLGNIINNPNQLTEVLVIPGSNIEEGEMPPPTGSPESPVMIVTDSTVSYSAGSQVRIPIMYYGNNVSGINCQVNGADSYFSIPVSAGNSGTMVLPVGIPSNVGTGSFCINFTIFDAAGNISNSFQTCITVTSALGCGIQKVSGGEGITSTLHNMGPNPGVVKIEYETYTVPDRIDVFYNGMWVAGTGSDPGSLGTVPPLADCGNPTDGYVGQAGTFCFTYDPANFRSIQAKRNKGVMPRSDLLVSDGLHYVEVVVSGCVRGGTAWKYTIGCTDSGDDCMLGQDGNPRFNLQFDGDVDFDLYVKDPSGEIISYSNTMSSSGGQLDVDCICCSHGNENIFWPDGAGPSGQYEFWVDFYSACSTSQSNFRISVIRNGTTVDVKTGTLTTVGEESTHWFYNHTP